MSFISPRKFAIFISLIVIALGGAYFSFGNSWAVNDEYTPPPPEEFDQTVGEQIVEGKDAPTFVGAADLNGDGKGDLVTANNNGRFTVFLNANGTPDTVYGPFRNDGVGIELGGEMGALVGGSVNEDQDDSVDLVIAVKPQQEIVKNETVGEVTSVGTDFLEDADANFRPSELKGLKLKPDIEKDETYEIASNFEQFISVNGSEVDLTEVTAPGKKYSVEKLGEKEKVTGQVKVFLNNGQAAFREAECEVPFTLPENTTVGTLELGNFNDDTLPDLAVTYTQMITGTNTMIEFSDVEVTGSGRKGSPNHITATMVLTDDNATFPDLNGGYVRPNTEHDYEFPITSSTRTSLEAEIELVTNLAYVGEGYLYSLFPDDTEYQIKLGGTINAMYRNIGKGCFQPADGISGEITQAFYSHIYGDPDPNAMRSGVYSRNAEFLPPYDDNNPAAGLKGLEFLPISELNPDGQTFTITSYDKTTVYFDPVDGDITSLVTDRDESRIPDTFRIDRPPFFYSPDKVLESAVNTYIIPIEYLNYAVPLGDLGPPYPGAFNDFNGDGRDDFVYVNLNLFYKENQG